VTRASLASAIVAALERRLAARRAELEFLATHAITNGRAAAESK